MWVRDGEAGAAGVLSGASRRSSGSLGLEVRILGRAHRHFEVATQKAPVPLVPLQVVHFRTDPPHEPAVALLQLVGHLAAPLQGTTPLGLWAEPAQKATVALHVVAARPAPAAAGVPRRARAPVLQPLQQLLVLLAQRADLHHVVAVRGAHEHFVDLLDEAAVALDQVCLLALLQRGRGFRGEVQSRSRSGAARLRVARRAARLRTQTRKRMCEAKLWTYTGLIVIHAMINQISPHLHSSISLFGGEGVLTTRCTTLE